MGHPGGGGDGLPGGGGGFLGGSGGFAAVVFGVRFPPGPVDMALRIASLVSFGGGGAGGPLGTGGGPGFVGRSR